MRLHAKAKHMKMCTGRFPGVRILKDSKPDPFLTEWIITLPVKRGNADSLTAGPYTDIPAWTLREL